MWSHVTEAVAADAPTTTASTATVATAAGADVPAYRVGRGDELNFRFTYTPELNTVALVRADGRVSLPLLGDVLVEGMEVQSIARQVETALAARVKRPQVVVNLQGQAASQRVFVGGEVGLPGAQPLVGALTVLQAVMAAQGLKDTAQAGDVIVLRARPEGEPVQIKVDLAGLMSGRAGARDVPLMPQDVVLVPRSGVASLNVWVDQYLRRNLPINFGVNYTINQNRGQQ